MKPFTDMKDEASRDSRECELICPKPKTCPLNRVRAGMLVRIQALSASPEITRHLREIGFGEQQVIRLLTSHSNLICQVCNARLALSAQLAQMIMVEPLAA